MFDWILDVVRTLGYPGIALLTLIENVVPPIPSELIMPFAGFLAERGDLALWGTIAAGTAGSVVGPATWVVVGAGVVWYAYRVITYDGSHDDDGGRP